jgi:arylsulfatase A-like enzyme
MILDRSVQSVVDALEKNGLAENTLVVFMSDNGGYLNYGRRFENISSNGKLRGQKGQVYEGGHRVPCIVYWPGKVKSNQVSHEKVMTMDFFPTIAGLAGAPLPTHQKIDGVDMSRLLMKGQRINERTLFWRKGKAKAVRKGPWKLVSKGDQVELYNLEEDLSEQKNLANEKTELVLELTKALANWEKEVESGFTINSK